ncbi:hypothetical protein OAU50_01765 [Planctomycetota bacterium]|nr:hypothetical protein [Planctomycetota bacterium]
MSRMVLVVFALLFSCSVSAQSFDPAEYFDPSDVSKNADTGLVEVREALTGEKLPSWVRVSVSGPGLAGKRFDVDSPGLVFKPDKTSGTVEAGLSVKITDGSFSVQVVELAVKASVAWHVHTDSNEYLIELKHTKPDEGRFTVRVFTGRRFMVVGVCDQTLSTFALPMTLSIDVAAKSLSAKLKMPAQTIAQTAPIEGKTFQAGLAVSDSRAKVKDLVVAGIFDADWQSEAASQMFAERALADLSQYARNGATRGLFAATHPDFDAQWKALSEVQRKHWQTASKAADFKTLTELAGKQGGLLYEVGRLAASIGEYPAAVAKFEASFVASKFPIAKLAAIEAAYVTGQEAGAIKVLRAAENTLGKLNAAQQAEFDLMLARYRVAGGDGIGSAAGLAQHAEAENVRPALQAFAASAQELLQPSIPLHEVTGPFGVQVLTDLPVAELKALFETLKPIEREIKNWVPEKQADCSTGFLAIYTDPVRYLTAALLPAGRNLDQAAGMFMKRGIGDAPTILACGAFGRDELYRTLSHELWHMVASKNDIPRWLDEGMAMCLSTAREDAGTMSFDAMPSELTPAQREQVFAMTIEDVEAALKADAQEFYGKGVRINYAVAWAWVWWLSESTEGRQQLRAAIQGEAVDMSTDDEAIKSACQAITKKFKPKES